MKSILDKDFQQLCFKAWTTWGQEKQLDMVIEECAELIHAISKLKRGKIREGKVVEEAIDVYLMLGQLITMIGGPILWNKYFKEKTERLKKRLEKEEC